MSILLVHNHYQQRGGEDVVFENETALLESHGHRVVHFTAHNDDVAGMGKLALLKKTVWNDEIVQRLRAFIRREKPAVMHVHNTLPILSPAVFHAAKAEGVPTVMTLHNYRLLCPSALLYRDGQVCESCVGKAFAWPAVVHACYRGSRTATAAVAATTAWHRQIGTWGEKVDAYIALTEFGKQKFIEGGLPAAKLHVKPNFLADDPGAGTHEGGFALFVGRLTAEKGVRTLIQAWQHFGASLPLKIVGDGPLAEEVRAAAELLPGVEWLGLQPKAQVIALMQQAALVVAPSEWYEGMPLTLVEAFACGTPVVTTSIGAQAAVATHGKTGWQFTPRDVRGLADAVQHLQRNPELRRAMGRAARAEFEQLYTASANYHQLLRIYEAAGAKLPSHALRRAA